MPDDPANVALALPPPAPPAERWPRLSDTLPHARCLDTCQACGRTADDRDTVLTRERLADGQDLPVFPRWQEHDDQDKPEPLVVVLCERCSSRLIEPHPRLYHRLPVYKPVPGAMGVCVGCVHNDRLGCRAPAALINGGTGINVTIARPTVALVASRRGGRRAGWREEWWSAPATACDARAKVVP